MMTGKTKHWLPFIGTALCLSAMMLRMPLPAQAQPLDKQPTAAQKAPELMTQPQNWINTGGKAIHLYQKDGSFSPHIYVLTFWTHGCINCKRTVGFWNDWSKRYKDDVSVVSVHTPEADFERNPTNVKRFVKQKGIIFPVVADNDYAIWNAYGVKSWPTTILIDKQGKIRARWEGELNYDNSGEYKKVEATIDELRREK